ncbi:MAG: sigma-54-dependent Fis family transcriptional regulator [Gammaproteobacteria bacterium]|nr:sigma-54-dependent Fis family transcriptional regulator [Gammaproteobacteria bacterium]
MADQITTGTVLIVDDDEDMLRLVATWLNHAGYATHTATTGADALTRIAISRPDVVITDLFMEGMNGLALLTKIHASNPLLPVIMLSGQAQIPDAVQATHLGTAAFLTKPIAKEQLLKEVRQHLATATVRRGRKGIFAERLIHRSALISELIEQSELLAQSDVSVFIAGETGTGKEVLAHAIHDASPRRERPFIGINCGAIPEQLLESELFGHEKGAFTGAHNRHDGLFLAADGGTLFLDEIGDMPHGLQVKLLRVLQDLQVRPVGSTKSVPINVRVISATHHDLEALVKAGEFRDDLYYRLNVIPLRMPSLVERREDIALLLEHFLARHAEKVHGLKKRFEPDALEYLTAAAWPGNVRQLMNAVELCATLTAGGIIPLAMAMRALREESGSMQTLKEAREDFEKKYLISVMRVANGNVATAARIAGRNRTEFYKLLGTYGIEAGEFRAAAE